MEDLREDLPSALADGEAEPFSLDAAMAFSGHTPPA